VPRTVTLLAAATEMVAAVGAADQLVGVSHECDHPPEAVAGRPVVTRTRVAPGPSSLAVDRSVRQLVRDALAVYDIDTEALEALAPEVIITQDLCRVCAVSVDDVRAAAARLAGIASLELVTLHPRSLGDILQDLRRVAAALGRPAEGEQAAAALEARIRRVGQTTAGVGERPRVLSVEWMEPVMLGGLWMPELIELAGGEPLVVAPGEPAPTVGRELLEGLHPDVVVVKPCGFTLERSLSELPVLRRVLPWREWTTGPQATRVYVADGHAYFNRSGPRIVDSLELLAACLHPTHFPDLTARLPGRVVRVTPELEPIPA
jgi:iron complex transport system substrate-binding protein